MLIKSIHKTYLKRSLKDSSELSDKEKSLVCLGSEIEVFVIESIHQHLKINFSGEIFYIFKPHWKLLHFGFFPSGLLKPLLPINPSTDTVIETIVKYCIEVGVNELRHIAYVLATAEGESNFKPIKEIRGKTLTKDQKRYWHTNYMGRGIIQTTWKNNYAKVGNALGIDLVAKPELLLTYPISIAALVIGMRDGWYTNKKLSDYSDYWSMRNIVNPGEIKYKRYHHIAIKFVKNAEKWEGYLIKFKDMYPGLVL